MSLFKARDYWVAQCGAGEEFDSNCLCVANVDNDPNGEVKIITGSLQGSLRIYLPKERDYKPEDLLLEQEFDHAILQLEVGRFSASGGLQLAVLHPRKLVVYSVQSMGSQYLQINKLFEHYLEHTAANMCYGPFGGVQGLDYICIQSYDGMLTFVESEAFAFSRYLPGFLIPGPLAYIEQSDSFLTCNSAFELECYKYKTLAAASGEKVAEGAKQPGGLHQAKRVQADWKIILGESAIDIRAGSLSPGQQSYEADAVVLCEHTVFVVSSSATITFQKMLEYHPACCTTYAAPGAKLPGGLENLLVASHNKSLLVYRGNVLCWSAKTDIQPIAVRVADLMGGQMRGMVVLLDDSGHLTVSYLGTDPMLNPVGFGEGKPLDYEAMGREQRSLAAIIREHAGGRRAEPADRMIMRAQVPAVFDSFREGSERGLTSSGRLQHKLSVKLYLVYQGGSSSADNVTLTIRAPEPVEVDRTTVTLRSVRSDPSDPTVVPLVFTPATAARLPTSTTALVVATFTAPGGEPRSQSLEVALPMCLFASVISPVKNAGYKVTIGINRPPPQLTAVFEDVIVCAPSNVAQALASGSGGGANVMSFQFPTGQDVTVVVSKNGGRYRLQSDTLEAMWLVLWEVVRRLRAYYQAAEAGTGPPPGEGPLAVMFEDPLPLDDFFEVVDQHFSGRVRVRELKKSVEDRAVQFRVIQKRLLMRFKDKNPSPLNQLDFLMEETYNSLMEAGALMETAQAQVASASIKLGCVVQLMLQLIEFKFGLPPAEASVLRSYLSPEVEDGEEHGWEEMTEAAMTHLLRSALAKNAKEAAVQVPPLAPSRDTVKLKKHISLVLERLSRGMRMALDAEDGGEQATLGGAGSRSMPRRN